MEKYIFYFTSIFFVILLFYLIIYFLIYILLYFYSRKKYRSNKMYDLTEMDSVIKSSPFLSGISVLAPAFNEGLTIIQNVKSLLSLDYPNYEVVVINDGSTDDSLEKLTREFSLVRVDFEPYSHIPTATIRGYYRSGKPEFCKLLVVDKENAKTKADASNAGLNVCKHPYILTTDVDCILATETLWTMIKPILYTADKRLIGVGASIKLANSSEFKNGKIIKYISPKDFLPRHQEVEYLRVFHLGKAGWSYINSVSNISGALALWEREVMVDNGGYNIKSLGEDMELTLKLKENMLLNNEDYQIEYLHNTVCWTEAPDTLKMFTRQRVRWAKGLIHAMKSIRTSIFNPKRKQLGMIVSPYIIMYEILAPVIEFIGMFVTAYLILSGTIEVLMAVHIFIIGYLMSLLLSSLSVNIAFAFFKEYKAGDYINYYKAILIEPFFYHPLIMYTVLKGFHDCIFRKSGNNKWHLIERKGFEHGSIDDSSQQLAS